MKHQPSRVAFELVEPRLVSIHIFGTLGTEQAEEVLSRIEASVAEEPYFLLEVFMMDMDGATPEARRISAERLNQLPQRAIAIVGGNFAQRLIAKLILKATSLLGKGNNVGAFFKDSTSARDWLREYGTIYSAKSV